MLIKKFALSQKAAFSRLFSTYYTFQDSVFNFALDVKVKSILDAKEFPKTVETIKEAHKNGVDQLIVHLQPNTDLTDIANIAQQIKGLKEQLPDLKIQGLRYPMKFDQQSRNFLKNEFLFGLKASQLVSDGHYPQTYFLAESNELFKSALSKDAKEFYQKGLFNFEVLESTAQALEFSNLVFMLKHEDGLVTPENIKKFYEVFKERSIGFDLELNKAFVRQPHEDKKKNTAEFIKNTYAFEPHIRALNLYDFAFVEPEALPKEHGLEDAAVSKEESGLPKEKVPQQVDIGKGIFDFKLLFDLVKMSKFKGVLIFPETTSGEAISKLIELAKGNDFKTKNASEVQQYIKQKEAKSKDEGVEYRL